MTYHPLHQYIYLFVVFMNHSTLINKIVNTSTPNKNA